MTWELFKKVIDDIKGFKSPLKMLRLAANGEPLINKDLPRMIKYAKEAGVSEHIELVTNASLLTKELSEAIVEAGLNRIRISIEGIDAEGYKKIYDKFDIEKGKDCTDMRYEKLTFVHSHFIVL